MTDEYYISFDESMQTTEEMFQFIFTYMPYKQGDENISLKNN